MCEDADENNFSKSFKWSTNQATLVKLDNTPNAKVKESKYLKKTIDLTYNPCEKFWMLSQHIIEDNTIEQSIMDDVIPAQSEDEAGLSLIVISEKTLPSILFKYPVVVFYATIVYALFKVFRATMVPEAV